MNDFSKVFKKRLSVCMAEAEMDAKDLSSKTGISIDSIYKYRRGEAIPLLETACLIANALGCTPNDLCGWEEQR